MAEKLTYDVAKLKFELFCDRRDLPILSFIHNPRNSRQFLGSCVGDDGDTVFYLISQNGRFYLHDNKTKKWDEVPFVLEEVES